MDEVAHEREIVRMGSTLEYETQAGDTRTVTLVFPQDEDISSDRISILTPIGVALIGLSVGDSMDWRRRDGSSQRLRVTRILMPASRPAESEVYAALAS
jgi:regulator of nucleoside diphosphate kinase